ncbi:alanine--tRNA ligase-related protein [Fontisphaera persica]|uniref:alanine--tRNA ligase-related protein n=1 Tax=Fontisphaera persica TaxID=2974023 RepID=UPI0024C079A9|nr:alanine--tRNA ligase-related protein [Fontisphaera persica]WCJ57904.1 alanine--tRNA ligase-related protein [Fontisphaera persica]
MTSRDIRQSFLDFFRSKQHTIVPSSSLLPDSPNLLFTNAGMNQFVPIFLGQIPCPYQPGRAADTQKCIRAGGKHNDLEDVGLDTYHHTFFEMLGNWSFGDYFKKEAIEWAWELVVGLWKFPPQRLYATVYKPGPGEPAEFDQEAYDLWAAIFSQAGLDPHVHIHYGGKKDNFWMMGETGPCGPCSELHVDLTPAGDTRGALVNKGSAQCIEIWNLVFMQFNANPDGSFSPLPAKSVDTGMGFERVTGIIQNTRGFTDFSRIISNYETDIFRPLFDRLEALSGKKYGATLPRPDAAGNLVPATEQERVDVAFRVIADHIRTLSFAIADGILPGNTDRHYVLRRILRRAVRYGRSLGFHEPFFFKLVPVLAETMGDVFPEIRARQAHVEEVIRQEEEAFNRTLDRGIELFNQYVESVSGTARVSRAGSGVPPEPSPKNIHYSKRNLPHFERPWSKYMVTFSTYNHRVLTPEERDRVLDSLIFGHREKRYFLYAACVMPDHVHLLIEPQIKQEDASGTPVFWSLTEILHGIKSFTAHQINRLRGADGPVWEKESFDRLIRGQADLEEKFHYICQNPWRAKIVSESEGYPWVWTKQNERDTPRRDAEVSTRDACAPRDPTEAHQPLVISGDFAFKLYDTYGFPLDLTELMARERGLKVDVAEFNRLMEEQRERARKAQKREIIELSQIETDTPTRFVGFDTLQTPARVLEVVQIKDKTAVILDATACYAEMGGQVGDTGELRAGEICWRIEDTQKSGATWLHYLSLSDNPPSRLPQPGEPVLLQVEAPRRASIQRHHTVTHLLHWAIHEVVSPEASQKGSFVGPDKLTFDFNCPPLTPQQVADVEKLVNERILENAGVSWTEVPYAEVKGRKDVMQFFGDKYGDTVRVVQIGGHPGRLDGYSMELCGGTHTRATGEIGLFRIVAETAIAAGVRRIEAVAGLESYRRAWDEARRLRALADKLNTPVGELEKRIENLLQQQKELEKQWRALQQKQAGEMARSLTTKARTINQVPVIIERVDADADTLQAMVNELKGCFQGVVVLGGAAQNAVTLMATVSPAYTQRVQAGKILQQIAPITGGKGGGKPDFARGGGKEVSRLDEALAKAATLI